MIAAPYRVGSTKARFDGESGNAYPKPLGDMAISGFWSVP